MQGEGPAKHHGQLCSKWPLHRNELITHPRQSMLLSLQAQICRLTTHCRRLFLWVTAQLQSVCRCTVQVAHLEESRDIHLLLLMVVVTVESHLPGMAVGRQVSVARHEGHHLLPAQAVQVGGGHQSQLTVLLEGLRKVKGCGWVGV